MKRSTHYNRGGFAALFAALLIPISALAGITANVTVTPSSLTITRTTSGSISTPSWATRVCATLVGGGGGGAGGGPTEANAGGGAGGGALAITNFCVPVTPSATLTATIGAGGAGGIRGETSPATAFTAGSPGGNTTLTGALQEIPIAFGGGAGCARALSCDAGTASGTGLGGAGGTNSSTNVLWFAPVPTTVSATIGNKPTVSNTFGPYVPGSSGGGGPNAAGTGLASPCYDGTNVQPGNQSVSGASGSGGGCTFYGKGGAGGNSAAPVAQAGNPGTGFGSGGGSGGASDSSAGAAAKGGAGGAGAPGVVSATFYP